MRLGIAALTLTVGLGFVGMASAEESGNWFTRLFTSANKTESAKKPESKIEPLITPAKSAEIRILRAKADLERRQEVCLRLIDIADATGDEELRRKAMMLDQRAWDLYVASTNLPQAVESDVKKGDRK